MSLKLGNTNIAGTQVLYSTTGNNTDGAMTQAATTTALNNKADNSVVNLKADDTDVVHLTGNETITGVKSYLAMPALIFPNETRGTAPSSASYGGIVFLDGDGERMAILEKDHLTNGNISFNLRAANPTTTGTGSQATLGVTYPMSGNPYASAPASDVNGSIVTTVNKSKAANGYFKFGNGLIIQWGHVAAASGDTKTVTFPTAFSNTNYYVHSNTNRSGSTSSGWGYVTSKTKTNCVLTTSSDACDWIAVGY